MDRNAMHVGPGLVLAVILWLVLDSSVLAQTPSISIEGTSLSLGMPKALTLSQLEKSFTLHCLKEDPCDTVVLLSKTGLTALGSVSFTDGKVISVEKHWSPAFKDSDPGPFFKAFFTLLTKLQKEGYSIAHVSTNESREPTGTMLNISLRVGGKNVHITYTEGIVFQGQKLPPSVGLNEFLGVF